MQLFTDGVGLPRDDRLQVTFLRTKATRWYPLAIPRSDGPTNWTLSNVKLMEHYAPCNAAEALCRLRQVNQGGTIRDYTNTFGEALAHCGSFFVEGLHPGIRRFVHMSQPLTLSHSIRMAVYMYAGVEAADRAPPRPLANLEADLRSFDRRDRTGHRRWPRPRF